MAGYRLFLKPSAAKELDKIGSKLDRRRIVAKIDDLASDPRPHGSEKLTGYEDRYRVRQGDFHLVYLIDEKDRIVTVFKIGHRREIYR